MNRYRYTKQKDGKYSTTRYPDIKERPDDIIMEVKYGDRLDLLAVKYYKDGSLWWIIAKANALPGDSYYINLEQKIRIPVDYLNIIKRLRG